MTTPGLSRGRAALLALDTTSPPFNWCDRRCERCPLAGECALLRGGGEERDTRDGVEDGDSLLHRALSRLEKLVLLLDAAASRADRGADSPPSPPDEGLESAADAVLFGLGDLLDARERGTLVEPFEGLVSATAFVIGRARRLAAGGPFALQTAGGSSLDWDTSASVVVLDRSLAALRRAVETLRPAGPAAALAAGLTALAPEVARWNTLVSDGFRIALGARIREGTAPSPFCTTDH